MSNKGAKNVETVYPLTPMQEGMLFHSLYELESGLYIEQIRLSFAGKLDPSLFQEAWKEVVLRHAPLRTLFLWKKQKQPLQVVRRHVELEWTFKDARNAPPTERDSLIQNITQENRDKGFDLTKAPLSRWTLVQTGDETWEFIWTWHHMIPVSYTHLTLPTIYSV